MKIKQLFGLIPLPVEAEMLYKEMIKKRIILNNGWDVIILTNNFACLYKQGYSSFMVGTVKKVFEAADGKFMLVKENGEKSIFQSDGEQIADFCKETELYKNGWFKTLDTEGLTLYDADQNPVGQRLKATEVFKNGGYFMTVNQSKDATIAGVYDTKRERLMFTNSPRVAMFKNGWFVVDGGLYDNLGNEFYYSATHTSGIRVLLLKCIGRFMSVRKVKLAPAVVK